MWFFNGFCTAFALYKSNDFTFYLYYHIADFLTASCNTSIGTTKINDQSLKEKQ
jgi:hypothetical protein